MQVSVETTTGLERRLTIEVPADQVDGEIEGRLKSLTKTARIDGFRKGKVPLKVVTKMYGNQVRQEVVGDMMQRTFYEALTKENLRPAGSPNIEASSNEPGKALEYTATFEVYPEVALAAMDNVEIEKPVVEIGDQDIDNMIEKVRAQHTTWVPVESVAKDGNRIVIDFFGRIDNEPFNGNEGQNVPIVLGAGRMINGFEEQLQGLAPGDEKVLDLSFPDDYHYKEVAGKPVKFEVKVNAVEESQLPELNEDFVKGLGVADGNLDNFRSELKVTMIHELDQKLKSTVKQQVTEKLVELNAIELPKALITQEIETLRKQANLDESTLEEQDSFFREQAEKRVALGMIFSEIIKVNNLSVPAERLREQVEKMASSYDRPEEVIAWYYGDRQRLSDVEAVVMEEIIVDWVLDKCKVNEVQSTFDVVMNSQ
jgi:trigger factor